MEYFFSYFLRLAGFLDFYFILFLWCYFSIFYFWFPFIYVFFFFLAILVRCGYGFVIDFLFFVFLFSLFFEYVLFFVLFIIFYLFFTFLVYRVSVLVLGLLIFFSLHFLLSYNSFFISSSSTFSSCFPPSSSFAMRLETLTLLYTSFLLVFSLFLLSVILSSSPSPRLPYVPPSSFRQGVEVLRRPLRLNSCITSPA